MPGRARRGIRLRQVDVRGPALLSDGGRVVGLLSRARRRRRERPDRNRRGVRGAAHDRRQSASRAAGSSSSTRRASVPKTANPSSRSPAAITCSPSRSCSTSRRKSVGNETTASRPRLRRARHPQPAQRSSADRSRTSTARASSAYTRCTARDEIEAATVVRERLWTDRRDLTGPFDIIGDIHGCHAELVALMTELGWTVNADGTDATHPDGRMAVFVGDLVDRGPATPAVLRLVMNLVAAGPRGVHSGQPREQAAARARRPQRHDQPRPRRVARAARRGTGRVPNRGRPLDRRAREPRRPRRRQTSSSRTRACPRACTAARRARCGRSPCTATRPARPTSSACRSATRGPNDYRGHAVVVYGHTPVPEPTWVNGTICIDTGCVFGGKLTALRWPERDLRLRARSEGLLRAHEAARRRSRRVITTSSTSTTCSANASSRPA